MDPRLLEQNRIERIHHTPQTSEVVKRLEDSNLIKLLPDEKILSVQRQHWLVIFGRMIFPLFVAVVALIIALILPLDNLYALLPNALYLKTFFTLSVICLLFAVVIYEYLSWYYQFYIVTSRCLMHIHFFRIGGFFFEEVFLDQMMQQEITRRAPNLFFDVLGIYDVYVEFSQLDRPEPFIFKSPSDSQYIEDLVENLTIEEIKKKEAQK
jgi:hypothetical protein